jgi:hypothetical protein
MNFPSTFASCCILKIFDFAIDVQFFLQRAFGPGNPLYADSAFAAAAQKRCALLVSAVGRLSFLQHIAEIIPIIFVIDINMTSSTGACAWAKRTARSKKM